MVKEIVDRSVVSDEISSQLTRVVTTQKADFEKKSGSL
jgi:hypothetical protein